MKLKSASLFLIPACTFFLGLGTSKFIVDHLPLKSTFVETRHQGNYKFINPLLECDSANFGQDPNLWHLKSDIQSVLDTHLNNKNITFASIYYRDLNNGPWIGINEKEDFSPSSLIKVPLMIAYYKLAEADPSILQKTLSYNQPYDYRNQNFIPPVTIVPERQYTVEQLIDNMIIYSDNAAYTLLNNYIDAQIVIQTYNDLGVDISKGFNDPNGDILSVKAYASFFRILYNSSYLSKSMSEKALLLLSQSTFTTGLKDGVPSSVPVAHKFGERQYIDTGQKQLHDCGIVYLPGKPYLICIMTRGQDFKKLTSAIKDVSAAIYTNLNKD